ncbi:hypothetical protein HYDPIDRAFT_132032 [Hydnomerulius pinastri MD-312]|uniref:Acetyl-CoA synthetase-like protein n=1 Tax=Hydnomerulius pinastri MD-312 TaxID=994086 RepID=A0A0C9VGY3_9AGAM|nr:hypothetical protein HYDPIDRAFT_132032 [Hydnomerulius pinastri MD-312]
MGPTSFLLDQPRGVHARSPECSFSIPDLDGKLTLPQIYEWHLTHNKNHPVFAHVNQAGSWVHLTYSQVVPAARRAARYVMKACNISSSDQEVVRPFAIIATSNTVTYFTTLLGALLAAIPVFPISPGNSPAAIAHLLKTTGVSNVFVSDDQATRDLVDMTFKELTSEPVVWSHSMPSFEEIYASGQPADPLPERDYDFDATMVIVHSSGSTSFPKPIHWNHKSYLQVALMPHFGKHDLCGKVLGCHAVAMFHAIGLNCLAWLPSTGFVMATFDPQATVTWLTPESVYEGFQTCRDKLDFVFAVPSFIQIWSQDDNKVSYFATMKGGLIYGGGPLSKSCGDQLAANNVRIYTLYGSSEVGVIATIFPELQREDWEYFTINKHCAAELEPDGDGTYELIVIARPTQELSIINSNFKGEKAYETKDILAPHPSKPGLWKIIGRADDQIMLSNGEKTNPVPLEAIVNEHPQVASSVMFGRGRTQNGILVQLKDIPEIAEPNDVIESRNKIWLKVEEMNSFAPAHSKIFKEMIIFASRQKPFTFTPKGAPRRAKILEEYKDEIDQLYFQMEENTHYNPDVPTTWSAASSLEFARTIVHRVLGQGVRDDVNFFDIGCSSLDATWIRNSVLRGLRTPTSRALQDSELTFVYRYPTVKSLSQFILSNAGSIHGDDPCDVTVDQNLLTRYTTDFPTHTASQFVSLPAKDVVLVTGTTGSFGCAVLAHLASCDSIETIYALNRPSRTGKSLWERHETVFKERGYSVDVLRSRKVVLLEGEISENGLGCDKQSVHTLITSVTHIIHIAWPVNFNLALNSFETAIRGVRNLVDFALSSLLPTPPKIIFTSSVGVLYNWPRSLAVEEDPIYNATVPVGQGYGEAKWIAERILQIAREQTALHTVVVRVGQLSGATGGAWNTSDWFPLVLKSSVTLGILPQFQGVCPWIPVDAAAKVLCDFRSTDHDTLHITHPRPVDCAFIMRSISAELRLTQVSFPDWIKELEEGSLEGGIDEGSNPIRRGCDVPALKILPFLRDLRSRMDHYREDIAKTSRDCLGFPILKTDKALGSSPVLQSMDAGLSAADVLSWVQFWRSTGFLPMPLP